jgi:plasmid stabilization system protein ParE
MSEVKWLPEAVDDVNRLYEFLSTKDQEAATSAIGAILKGARHLKAHPRLGRPMDDETERRELFVSFGAGAYVLRYRLEDVMTATIIRIWHSRENRE